MWTSRGCFDALDFEFELLVPFLQVMDASVEVMLTVWAVLTSRRTDETG